MKPEGKGGRGRWRSAALGRESAMEGSVSGLYWRGNRLRRRSRVCGVGGKKAGVSRERYTADGDLTVAAADIRAAQRGGQKVREDGVEKRLDDGGDAFESLAVNFI